MVILKYRFEQFLEYMMACHHCPLKMSKAILLAFLHGRVEKHKKTQAKKESKSIKKRRRPSAFLSACSQLPSILANGKVVMLLFLIFPGGAIVYYCGIIAHYVTHKMSSVTIMVFAWVA
jgi:hypothetical protein